MKPLQNDEQPQWLLVVQLSTQALIGLSILMSFVLNVRSFFRGDEEVQIRLHEPAVPPVTRKDHFCASILNHIEDRGDKSGVDVEIPQFWSSVKPRRWISCLFILLNASLSAYHNYRTFLDFPTPWELARVVIESSVSFYVVLLTLHYALTTPFRRHRELTYHLFLISLCLTIHYYLSSIGQYLSFTTLPKISTYQYGSLLTALLANLTVGLVPLAPPQREDLTKLYNRAVSNALKQEGLPEGPNVSSELSSSILMQISFNWVSPMISRTAKTEQCDIQDLPAIPAHLRSQNLVRGVLQDQQTENISSRFGPILGLLWTVYAPQWKAVVTSYMLSLIMIPIWYIRPFALQNILWSLDNAASKESAMAWALMLIIARAGLLVLFVMQLNLNASYIEPRMRTHSAFLLYRKLMTRNTFASPTAVKGKGKSVTSKADILNLISSDVNDLCQVLFTFLDMFRSQVEMLLGCTYVWFLLGPSGLWGLSSLSITLIPQYVLTKWEYKIYEKRLEVSDKRIGLMQEAVQAIQMIKMMAAERFWYKRIKKVRDKEFRRWTQARMLSAISGFLYAAAPTIMVVISFAHYTLVAKKDLTATIAFTSITVFAELRPVLVSLPSKITDLLQEILAVKRIGTFIQARDVDYLHSDTTSVVRPNPAAPLVVKGTFAWDVPASESEQSSSVFQLEDIDLEFPRGEMTLIAGKFGSGKTLLLLTLLGEARLINGNITYAVSDVLDPESEGNDWSIVPTGVAYAPQIPWLQSMSIRENILFGLPMNMERYREVLHACALMPDLEVLEDADLTEIGERGKILSGGQKARVSLARAVYSRAATLLLDDVISAVDAQTSQHIVTHCFKGPLMQGRTILLASHAVESVASIAHNAIFLEDGKVVWKGSGPELLQSVHMAHLKTESPSTPAAGSPVHDKSADDGIKHTSDFVIKETTPKTPKQLLIDEARAKDNVELRHWKDLLAFNGGLVYWAGTILILLLVCVAPVASRKVLSDWTGSTKEDAAHRSVLFWVILYGAVALGDNLLGSVWGIYRFWGAIRAMKRIHAEMLESLLRAKMGFFTKTRAGSIVQRFGRDLSEVFSCSNLLGQFGSEVGNIIVSVLSISAVGSWAFGAIVICMFLMLYKPSVWYRAASVQIRRLESIIPGPINALYGETVAGAAVIRAFGVQSVFVKGMTNMKTNAVMWMKYMSRWLLINLRIIDVFILTAVLTIILRSPSMTGGTAGFMLAFAGGISGNLYSLLFVIRHIELKGISLERTTEYRLLEREDGAPLDEEESLDDGMENGVDCWPATGEITVKELSASYGPDLPDILRKVSFHIPSGQRVGIVGATGGGKSTLAKAFFSFVDITHGSIEIDGKDLSTIPLGHVRSKLGIIAQDPILLSGSLRLNLDIDGKFTDEQLYDALHQVQLIKRKTSGYASDNILVDLDDASPTSSTVIGNQHKDGKNAQRPENRNIFTNLDYEIKTGGENLSAGQKQLVVLARAVLKQHKVLILDEATASIDSATDAEISRVVHEEFAGATVLIIAHRLRTIMPCGKILVMDKGELVQQGTPAELISVEGKFQSLCMAAGIEEYQHLVSLSERFASPCSHIL